MEPLKTVCTYHIYNHAIGSDLLFKEDKNYTYFLEKYKKYITPVADTFAYCLMPNHFHLLIEVKEEDEVFSQLKSETAKEKYNNLTSTQEKENYLSLFVSKQFSNLFSSYTQAFNKMYERRGSLFIKNFKRKLIEDDSYFVRLINYIHFNPVTHGFVSKPEDWDFSSFNTIISDKSTIVKRDVVISLFDGIDNFKFCHLEPMDI